MTPIELVTIALAVVAPLLVGLVTTRVTSSGVRAVLLATLSAAVGVGIGFRDSPADVLWDWRAAVTAAFVAWVIAVATHFGLWKPTGIAARVQAVGSPSTASESPGA
jgi:hypothetical protein